MALKEVFDHICIHAKGSLLGGVTRERAKTMPRLDVSIFVSGPCIYESAMCNIPSVSF